MVRLFFVAACFALVILASFADKEYEEHGHDDDHHHHHHDHDGHDHHDHESHRKLFTGDDVGGTADELEKLRAIANKIDTDQNGQISREEMRTYVEQRIKDQHDREADDFISTLDPTKTNKITFNAYVRDNYGDLDVNKLEQMDKSDSRSRETRRTFLADKQKWIHLDKDGDQSLSYDEFRKFLRPEDDDDLRRIEINSIIKEYDEDNDGKVSSDEYLKMTEAETGQADPLGIELDTNNDGYADYHEFARYYLPTSSIAIEEETDHLLNECDTDKDGFCSPDEIVNAYSSFAGSQITDFGADLEAQREEL